MKKRLLLGVLILGIVPLTACENFESPSNTIKSPDTTQTESPIISPSTSTPESIPTHEHTYAIEWSKDETNHWHSSTCEHDLKEDEAEHTWDDGIETDDGEKFTCTVCGYEKIESYNINFDSIEIPEVIYVDLNGTIELLPDSVNKYIGKQLNIYALDTNIVSFDDNMICGDNIGNTSVVVSYGTKYKVVNVYVRKNIDFNKISCISNNIKTAINDINIIEIINVDEELLNYYSISYDKKTINVFDKNYDANKHKLEIFFNGKEPSKSKIEIEFEYYEKKKVIEVECESYLDIDDLYMTDVFDFKKVNYSVIDTLISFTGTLPNNYGINDMLVIDGENYLSEFDFNSETLEYNFSVSFPDLDNHSIVIEFQTCYGETRDVTLEFKGNKPITDFELNYSSRVNAGSSTIVKITIPEGCSGSYTVSADSGLSITEKTDFSNQQAFFTVKVNDYGYKYLTITVFSQDGTSISKKISIYGISLADNIRVSSDLKCKDYWNYVSNLHVKVKSYSIDVVPVSNTSAKIILSISWDISINSGLQMSVYLGSTLIGTMRQQSITSSNLVLIYNVTQDGSYNLSFDKLLFSPIF